MAKKRIKISLIPKTSFAKNVRTMAPEIWPLIRSLTLESAGDRCEICGSDTPPLECHEVWRFHKKVQRLVKFVALCKACHAAHHLGYAYLTGNEAVAILQLRTVNKWTRRQVDNAYYEALEVNRRRELVEWKIDISYAHRFVRPYLIDGQDVDKLWKEMQ